MEIERVHARTHTLLVTFESVDISSWISEWSSCHCR